MEKTFTLEYWIDDSWHIGRLKEVPGVFSQGESLQELEENICDAYKMVLKDQHEYTPMDKIKKERIVTVALKRNELTQPPSAKADGLARVGLKPTGPDINHPP